MRLLGGEEADSFFFGREASEGEEEEGADEDEDDDTFLDLFFFFAIFFRIAVKSPNQAGAGAADDSGTGGWAAAVGASRAENAVLGPAITWVGATTWWPGMKAGRAGNAGTGGVWAARAGPRQS